MSTTTARPASPAQIDLIITIGKEAREVTQGTAYDGVLTALAGAVKRGEVRTSKQASEMIEALKDLKAKARAEQRPAGRKSDPRSEPNPGMYRDKNSNGEFIYRVYLGQKSGRMLVKVVETDHANDGGYRYRYIGSAARSLPATAEPLSLDEAKQWGRMTGTCCVCARRLDNPESVDAGIGPVCAGRMEEGFTK